MKALFDDISQSCSKNVTKTYSTSFSLATKMLAPSIRQDIYNIYGFVRLADEIVDSFHDYDKAELFSRFELQLEEALSEKISLNPILNAFQYTVHKYSVDRRFYEQYAFGFDQKQLYHSRRISGLHLRFSRCGWTHVPESLCQW